MASKKGYQMEKNTNIWRDGNLLVMHKSATLPDRCVKTGQPASGQRLEQKFQWQSPVNFFIFILVAAFLIYLKLAVSLKAILLLPVAAILLVPKKVKVEVGLSEEFKKRKNRATKVSRVFYIIGLASIIMAGIKFTNELLCVSLIFVGLLLFGIGAICKADGGSLVSLKRIRGDYIWLSGISKDYLQDLPDWDRKGDKGVSPVI